MVMQSYTEWSTEALQEEADIIDKDIARGHEKIKNIELDLAAMHKLRAEYLAEINKRGISQNTCEHGDHSAPPGKRFCSNLCEKCEHESKNPDTGCDNICGLETTT